MFCRGRNGRWMIVRWLLFKFSHFHRVFVSTCECSGDQKFSVSLISWGIWTLCQLSRPLSSKLWQIFRSLLFYFSSVLSSHLKFKSHSVKYSQNLSNLFNSSSHFSASRLYHSNIYHTCDHPPLYPGLSPMSDVTDHWSPTEATLPGHSLYTGPGLLAMESWSWSAHFEMN